MHDPTIIKLPELDGRVEPERHIRGKLRSRMRYAEGAPRDHAGIERMKREAVDHLRRVANEITEWSKLCREFGCDV